MNLPFIALLLLAIAFFAVVFYSIQKLSED
jgi:hypothetical protein